MTSAVATLALLECLADYGVDKEIITQKTGIDSVIMDDPDIRIPLRQYLDLWKLTVETTGDPSLAIHLRDKYGQKITHFVIHIIINSNTVIEALDNWKRYFNLICEVNVVEYEIGENLEIIHSIASPEYQNIWMPEHSLSSIMKYGKHFLGQHFSPLKVLFQHAGPGNQGSYQKVFNCPVLFNQPKNAIVLPLQVLDYKVDRSDPHLQAYLKKQAEEIIQNRSQDHSTINRVQEIILAHIGSGRLDADFVSGLMGLSRSAVHRKLKQEGTTFNKLLQETRQLLAGSYLNLGMNSAQIAFLLGYAEPSSFQHAFKRWTGLNPGEFRKR